MDTSIRFLQMHALCFWYWLRHFFVCGIFAKWGCLDNSQSTPSPFAEYLLNYLTHSWITGSRRKTILFFSGVHVVSFISLFNPLTAYKSLEKSLIKKKVNCPQLAIMCVTDRRILMGISITCKCNHWVKLSSQTIPAVHHFYIKWLFI